MDKDNVLTIEELRKQIMNYMDREDYANQEVKGLTIELKLNGYKKTRKRLKKLIELANDARKTLESIESDGIKPNFILIEPSDAVLDFYEEGDEE